MNLKKLAALSFSTLTLSSASAALDYRTEVEKGRIELFRVTKNEYWGKRTSLNYLKFAANVDLDTCTFMPQSPRPFALYWKTGEKRSRQGVTPTEPLTSFERKQLKLYEKNVKVADDKKSAVLKYNYIHRKVRSLAANIRFELSYNEQYECEAKSYFTYKGAPMLFTRIHGKVEMFPVPRLTRVKIYEGRKRIKSFRVR